MYFIWKENIAFEAKSLLEIGAADEAEGQNGNKVIKSVITEVLCIQFLNGWVSSSGKCELELFRHSTKFVEVALLYFWLTL